MTTQISRESAPCSASHAPNSSGLSTASCSPISIASRSDLSPPYAPTFPFLAQYPHHHQIVICPRAPDVVAQSALLDEAAGAVGPDRALIVPPDAQPDPPPVAQPEGVVEQQPDCLAPVALV